MMRNLQPKYYWLSSGVGLLGVFLGYGALPAVIASITTSFGIPYNASILSHQYGTLCLGLILVSIPICLYGQCATVTLTGALMLEILILRGHDQPTEACLGDE